MLAVYSSGAFTTASGVAVAALATVEVRLDGPGGGALATIYSDVDGTTPISQPGFAADSNGRFVFYAAGRKGGYQITVTKAGGGESVVLHNQAIGMAAQLDPTAVGEAVLTAADAPTALAALSSSALGAVLRRLYGTL
jgi:hypothetical protein